MSRHDGWWCFSFHSEAAAWVLAGRKRVEFRRVRASVKPGDRVFIYEVQPVGKITGRFTVETVVHGPPAELLELERDPDARALAAPYLEGAKVATAIVIAQPRKLESAFACHSFHALTGLDRPPQSYGRCR